MLIIRNIKFLIVYIYLYIKILNLLFFNFLNINKFLSILLTLLKLKFYKIFLSSISNKVKVNNLNNLIIFNIKIIGVSILVIFWIKNEEDLAKAMKLKYLI